MAEEDFKELYQLLDEWKSYTSQLETILKKENKTSDDETQIVELAYENYASLLELSDYLKEISKQYRKVFKVKESDVRKWMSNDEEKSE